MSVPCKASAPALPLQPAKFLFVLCLPPVRHRSLGASAQLSARQCTSFWTAQPLEATVGSVIANPGHISPCGTWSKFSYL